MTCRPNPSGTRFDTGYNTPRHASPFLYAFLFFIVYICLTGAYIYISSTMAASASADISQLKNIEILKGFLFISSTGLIIFILAYILLKKIYRKDKELILYRELLIENERRAMAGIFAASIAHDIKNLLNIVTVSLDLSQLDQSKDLQTQYMTESHSALEKITQLTNSLMHASQPAMMRSKKTADLRLLIENTIDFCAHHEKVKFCTINMELESGLFLELNEEIMTRILLNLIINAGDATHGKGCITVKCYHDKSSIILEVHDNGPGIDRQHRKKIFEPFISMKEQGTGLGLMVVNLGVRLHNASIKVLDSDMGGACFRIKFPKNNSSDGSQSS